MYASGLGRDCLPHTPLWEDPPDRHPTPGQTPRADTPRADTPGQTLPQADTPPPAQCMLGYTPCTVHSGIRSTSGRYASDWNAFFLDCVIILQNSFGGKIQIRVFLWKSRQPRYCVAVKHLFASQFSSLVYHCMLLHLLLLYQTTGENPLQIEILKNIACLWKTRLLNCTKSAPKKNKLPSEKFSFGLRKFPLHFLSLCNYFNYILCDLGPEHNCLPGAILIFNFLVTFYDGFDYNLVLFSYHVIKICDQIKLVHAGVSRHSNEISSFPSIKRNVYTEKVLSFFRFILLN